jgi:hypothetical protein
VSVVKMFRMREGIPATDGPSIVLGALGVVPSLSLSPGGETDLLNDGSKDVDHFGLIVLSSVGSAAGAAGGFPNAQEFSVPLILTRGSPKLVQVLLSWFEETFDMSISPLSLSPSQLSSFTAACAVAWRVEGESESESESEREREREREGERGGRRRKLNGGEAKRVLDEQKPLELSYALPPLVARAGLDRIALSLSPRSLAKLRDAAVASAPADPGAHLLDSLSRLFAASFRLPPPSLSLTHAGTPLAYISADGRLKPYAHPVLVLELLYNATW